MKPRATDFEIVPYESAGPIRFGMTSDEIRAQMDSPKALSHPRRDFDSDDNLGIRIHYGATRGVEAIEFHGPACPTLDGHRLLKQRYANLETWFATLDKGLKLEHSGLTSLEFGIRLYAASARNQPEVRVEVVTVFSAGYAKSYIMSVFPPSR